MRGSAVGGVAVDGRGHWPGWGVCPLGQAIDDLTR